MKKYMFELIQGNAIDVLKTMADESVHCVVTSPPYYGLRSYGTPPQVWGGSAGCQHQFGDETPRPGTEARNGEGANSTFAGREDKAEINAMLTPPPRTRTENDVINPDSKQATNKGAQYNATGGAYCLLCGAWRGHLGLEPTPEIFVQHLVEIFREVRRVLRKDGTLWLNLGDTYSATRWTENSPQKMNKMRDLHRGGAHDKGSGLPDKNLLGIPWRVAFALQSDGWYLRQDIIWHKPNPMPESVRDRCTKAHEYIFLLTKSAKYYYDWFAIKEKAAYDGRKDEQFKGGVKTYNGVMPDGQPHTFAQQGHPRWQKDENGERFRNKRSVWTVTTRSFREAHFATFPPTLIEPCILAGCPESGTVLDPFSGAGTTGIVALKHGRNYIGIELKPEYIQMSRKRIESEQDKMSLFNVTSPISIRVV